MSRMRVWVRVGPPPTPAAGVLNRQKTNCLNTSLSHEVFHQTKLKKKWIETFLFSSGYLSLYIIDLK